ncbi:sensor histidine kinase [Streptomyces sp. NPDC050788]|uniref:sensor histidine kinase n=1 Tax=Streptomyces sp. NPDC050788 TaxID=3155041 RepID=UPI00341CD3FD
MERTGQLIGRRQRWFLDVALAVAFTVVAVLLGREPEPGSQWQPQDALGIAITCLVNAPLAARRRLPLVVFALSSSVWVLFITLDYWPVVNSMGPFLALYTVASLRPLRPAAVCAVVMGAVWVYAGWRAGQPTPAVFAQAVVFPAVGCRFGVAARVSAHRADRLAELAEQLRREQQDRMRRAVAEEQRRIARELHDVVAHHMSVINVQGGLASYVFDSAPETARSAIRTINETSHEVLGELRRMLTLLRTDADTGGPHADPRHADGDAPESTPYTPMPGVSRLGEMAERITAAGVSVDLHIRGAPRPLTPGIELCAYRVVQEALTNVLKHARPANATVVVSYDPRELTITVTDDGRPHRSLPDNVPPSSGHGLIGMRERARLYGGTLDVGRRAEGGFRVRLVLPA